ncbi:MULTISPECIES: hypothetical protein [Gammaproteobacteria]|uniref:hypothetical protein n=1 Tax=Gammaproteobacteria TaxID=1236 RepID=UPI00079172D4|nr:MULTISPECIES: hypothetical protein [Gammaproteobacteria]EAO5102697.1 hypothetical protein [Salmonella enterica]EBS0352152.1 hypothetical protein [Salmonella enterica subsp. enterica serovar Java]EBW7170455.1 hypothetical protein [Salmonella enterica subsp. enterica serovar Javiana]ECD7684213.1 hypothetical protein [Salmonella enterica subsp. enterica serovar Typhimurium]ECM3357646.1 hypothetical protein [Salmonella enterica subsp. enterica serovar Enteritidis]ECN4650353.1 hypothetical prot
MLNIKVITLVLLLAGSAVIGGAGTAVYINSASATADATAVLNCKPDQRPAETFKHVDPVNTGRDKGY